MRPWTHARRCENPVGKALLLQRGACRHGSHRHLPGDLGDDSPRTWGEDKGKRNFSTSSVCAPTVLEGIINCLWFYHRPPLSDLPGLHWLSSHHPDAPGRVGYVPRPYAVGGGAAH